MEESSVVSANIGLEQQQQQGDGGVTPGEQRAQSAEQQQQPDDISRSCLSLQEAEARLQEQEKKTRALVLGSRLVAILFLLAGIVIVPIGIMAKEDWSFAAAFYFAIQAGMGVGFGELYVKTSVMKVLVIFELILGSAMVVIVVTFLITRYLERAEEKQKEKGRTIRKVGALELGKSQQHSASLLIGVALLFCVYAAGVLYGLLYEEWNFVTSLYFIVSACQTSGLVPPTIDAFSSAGTFPSLFVTLLVVLGVPLWAYTIGKASLLMISIEQSRKRILNAVERERSAEQAFANALHRVQKGRHRLSWQDEEGATGVQVSELGFFVLWMLRNGLIDEPNLKSLMEEFDVLKEEQESYLSVPLWKVVARLRFWQSVELGLIDESAWPRIREEMHSEYNAD